MASVPIIPTDYRAEPGVATLTYGSSKSESPVATLNDPTSDAARTWLDKLDELLRSLESKSSFWAPESASRAIFDTITAIVAAFRKGERIVVWDLNRELSSDNAHFNDGAFGQAFHDLFPQS